MSDLQRIKKALEGAVNKRKQAELNSRSEEIMTTIGQDLVSALSPVLKEIAGQSGGNNESLVREITSAVTQAMKDVKIEMPHVEMPDNSIDLEPILDAIRNIKIDVPQSQVNVPAPIVNVPPTVFPEFPKYPEEIGLRGIDKMQPLPVMMMDSNGKQFQFPMGASGGKGDFFTIKSFSQSAFSELSNADGRLRVSVETGGSGLTDSELRASSVPVAQASGAIWSTSVTDIFGSTITSDVLNGDNRIRVSVETGGSGLTDSELRASAVPVSQVSGASWSIEATQAGTWNIGTVTTVTGVTNSIQASIIDSSGVGYSGSNPVPAIITQGGNTASIDTAGADNESNSSSRLNVRSHLSYYDGTTWDRVRGDSTDGLLVNLGANNDVVVSTIFGTTGTDVVNPDGRIKVELPSGASGLTDTELRASSVPVQQVSGVSWSTSVVSVSDIFSTTSTSSVVNPDNRVKVELPATSVTIGAGSAAIGSVTVNGSLNSMIATGVTLHDAVDTGDAPLKIGGVAVTTANPTAVAGGDRVNFRADDLGRQIVRPVQVRDLTATAYVSKTTGSTFGTETTLFAGATSTYHDLIYVLASNDSTAAIGMDIRSTTGGNVVMHLEIPANGTNGIATPVPYPAGDVGASWTIDLPDVTGTNVYVSALFSKEV